MNFKNQKKQVCLIILIVINNLLFAGNNPTIDSAKGFITQIAVTNENNSQPGFSVCVNDPKAGEVCMWRKLNTYNYQQLLDVANMAIIANKKVAISANFAGSLDSIVVYN